MQRLWLSLIIVGAFTATAASGGAKTDLDRIQGTWKFTKVQVGNEVEPAERLEKVRLVIKGNSVTVLLDGKPAPDVETIKLDSSKSPKTFELTATSYASKTFNSVSGTIGEVKPGENRQVPERQRDFEPPPGATKHKETLFGTYEIDGERFTLLIQGSREEKTVGEARDRPTMRMELQRVIERR